MVDCPSKTGVGSGSSLFTVSPSGAGASPSAGASSGAGSSIPICCKYSIAPDALSASSLFPAIYAFKPCISFKIASL